MILKHPFFVFVFLINYGWSQNLVPNGSFEEFSSLPSDFGQWDKCLHWLSPNNAIYPAYWPFASPDYFHMNGSGLVDLPNSVLGTVVPHTGDAIMGIVLFSAVPNASNTREYISVELTSPMVVGTTYAVSFWLANGVINHSLGSGTSCDHMGIHFSTGPLTQIDHEPIAVIPQLEIPNEIWATDWQQFTFNYTATTPCTHLTIGSFVDDSQVSLTIHAPLIVTGPVIAYYFIDDVVVTEFPVIEMPNIFTPDGNGTNDHFVPVTLKGIKDAHLSILNRWGELIVETDAITTGWDGQFNGQRCAEGVYFWTVNYEGENGQSYTIHGYVTVIR